MSKLIIESSLEKYEVLFGNFQTPSKNFVIVDSNVLIEGQNRAIRLDAQEALKNLRTVERVAHELAKFGLTRNDTITAIGGGFVQDISTFVASTYMRGVNWNFIPSTLAAMGDSCIGGKSSINIGNTKNLLGNFYPPNSILIDVNFVKTLPTLELVAGYSEIIKICFARGEKEFNLLIDLISQGDSPKNLEKIIYLSLECKKYFIENDEFDRGIRKLLNFGHSFGHALEAATDLTMQHGVAVLVGMLAACCHELSEQTEGVEKLRLAIYHQMRKVKVELLAQLENINLIAFEQHIKLDKKNTATELTLVLPLKNGLDLVSDSFRTGAIKRARMAYEKAVEEIADEVR